MPVELNTLEPQQSSDPLSQFILPNVQGIKPTPTPKGLQVNVGPAPQAPAEAIKPGAAAIPTPSRVPGVPAPAAPPAAQDPIQAQLQDPDTRRLLAEAMIGEGNSLQMQQAVMEVIFNRARQSGQSIKEVIEAEGQFTSMDYGVPGGNREALDAQGQAGSPAIQSAYGLIAKPNPAWKLPPNVTNFYNPSLQARMTQEHPDKYHGTPEWAKGTPAAAIGNTLFYAGDYKGGKAQQAPSGDQSDRDMAFARQYLLPSKEEIAAVNADQAKAREWLAKGVEAQGAMGQVYDEEMRGIEEDRTRMREVWDRYQKSNEALLKAFPDRRKMEEDALRQVSDQPRDPSRVLGQFLPMLAILGGAFTRAGAIGSLKAAGAAMNAAREHDDQALKRADDEYKDAITEVMDKASLVHQEMTDGITMAKDDTNALLQWAQVYGAKANIPFLIAAAYNKDEEGILAAHKMIGDSFANIWALQEKRDQDIYRQLQIANLRQAVEYGGTPKPYYDQDSGKTVMFYPKAPPGQQYRDEQGNILDPQPVHTSQLPTGRMYSASSALIQADMLKKGRPLTPDEVAADISRTNALNAANRIATGPWGVQVRSLNNAIGHLALLNDLASALQNGDIQLVNNIVQMIAQATGDSRVTNFETAKVIVADEVAKAITTGGGSVADREQAQQAFSRAESPEQLVGAVEVSRLLLGRQLGGLKIQYDATTRGQGAPFSDFITRDVQRFMPEDVGSQSATTTPIPGTTPATPTTPAVKAPHVISEKERTGWMNSVKKGREFVKQGRITKQQFEDGLTDKFGNVGDQALQQAVEGLP